MLFSVDDDELLLLDVIFINGTCHLFNLIRCFTISLSFVSNSLRDLLFFLFDIVVVAAAVVAIVVVDVGVILLRLCIF